MTITIPHYAALLGVSRQAVHEQIQKQKIEVASDFKATRKKANTIWDSEELSFENLALPDEAQYEFVVNFLTK